MNVSQRTIPCLLGVIAMLSLSACNGILEGIYDVPESDTTKTYGFVAVDEKKHTGRIYIDATDYTKWHYIDLHNQKVVTNDVDDTPPATWDFAIHRYDAKTNKGYVAECTVTDFQSLPPADLISDDLFVEDEWTTDKITIDMSQMMDGIISYAEDYYNTCLSKWLHVDTSVMPPIYILSGRIYLLRFSDGTYAALRLTNFMDDSAIKGFMTIDYLYPAQL